MKKVSFQKIRGFLLELYGAASVPEVLGKIVINNLVATSLRGVDSHGIRLAAHYLAEIKAGRINIRPRLKFKQKSPTTGILDADHTFGIVAGLEAVNHAVKLAKKYGTGAVAVKNSTHFGAAAIYSIMAAKQNMLAFSFTHVESLVVPFGGRKTVLGTNPICFAAPMAGEDPFCLDMATSAATWNRVMMHKKENRPLPKSWAVDSMGNTTVNPREAVGLMPLAGYKGYGLALMVEIVSSLLSGAPLGPELTRMFPPAGSKRKLGHFFMVIDIARFVPVNVFKRRIKLLATLLRRTPSAKGQDKVLVAGDPEKIHYKARRRSGIPVAQSLINDFNSLAENFGINKRL